jgi:asparagine N-glycosylation enzyme membrane subunit Stt3
MMSPATMAIATITVMLWIIWSDTIRARRPSQILYTVRIGLFLVVTAMLILNMVRYPHIYSAGTRSVTIVAVLIGLGGAAYFARRLVLRR